MDLCVISSTTTINPFHSCLIRHIGSLRLFKSHSLFLSCGGWSVSMFNGRLNKPIKPFELSCVSMKTESGGVRRSAASNASPKAEISVKEDWLPADLQVKLSVEAPTIVCEDCYQRVVSEFMKMSKIPGFRPGTRVPENIIVGFVGRHYD